MKTIAFFNNKSVAGTTSLVYHLSWMFADLGVPVLAVDLDPQANLTAMFLDQDRLANIWPCEDEHPATVYGAVRPILRGLGGISVPPLERISNDLGLLPGDLGLSLFEETLANQPANPAFSQIIDAVATGWAKLVLVDVGPNLSAINRAALMAADHVCLPLVPGPYSLQALRILGAALTKWRASSGQALATCGYVVVRKSYGNPMRRDPLLNRLPSAYRTHILNEEVPESLPNVADDPHCFAQLRPYPSLISLATAARKPMFELKPADGAIGAHVEAVRQCRADFLQLAMRLASAIGLPLPG